MPAARRLTLVDSGRSPRPLTCDELRVELVAARAERLVTASRLRECLRLAMRHLAAGHLGVVGTALVEALRLTEQEATRAQSMQAPECACGRIGPGHGHADEARAAA